MPFAQIERLLDPQFEVEGCYLLDHQEGVERVAPEHHTYESARSGRGPLAWRNHWLIVPLWSRTGDVMGAIWADDPTDRLIPSERKLQALRVFANQATTALDTAAQYEEMQFLAEHDPLTRLLNRRAFNERLEQEVSRSVRYGHPMSLVLCDLNGFKALNDRNGHAAGDEALEVVGGVLTSVLRDRRRRVSDRRRRVRPDPAGDRRGRGEGGGRPRRRGDDRGVRRAGRGARGRLRGRRLPARRRRSAAALPRRRPRDVRGEARACLAQVLTVRVRMPAEMGAATRRTVDLDLNDEQRSIQETVREFVDRRILPVAQENDINHHLDMGIIEGMAELGLLGAPIPPEHGGAGLDYVCEALICEEIERGESAFRTLISVHVGLNSLSLLKFGSDEQHRRYLEPMAKGEKLGCFGLTEPAAGSDVAAMLTTAIRQDDGTYLLNGQKNWISYATEADYALVFAKTDPSAGHRGISAFVVERAWDGRRGAPDPEQARASGPARRASSSSRTCRCPAENLVGAEGDGFKIAMHSLDQGRFTVAAGAVGVIRACLEASVKYANERQTFGKPIGKHQFVQDMIADMVLGYETSRLLVMQAAAAKDKGVRNTRETSLAKWHATESAFKAAHLAIQVHGAYGYSAEYPVERYFRNSRAPIIYEGTTQIHKMMQAEHALGYRKLNG